MKIITPADASAAKLKALIEYAQKHRGTIKELVELLSARTGEKVYRQYVENWLHPDPDKRIEPKLGIGLLLIEAGEKLMGKAKA